MLDDISYDKEFKVFYFDCPNCQSLCQVSKSEIHCKIFRHGIFKKTFQQIPPHSTKEECDTFIQNNEIWGCGKPFYFDGNVIQQCDYI